MRGRRVYVEVVLLDIFTMVSLAASEAEQTLLQNWVTLVPEGESEAEALLIVGDAAKAVFAPAVSSRARLVVAEVVPRTTVSTVVLADSTPLSFAEVRSPFFPGNPELAGVVQRFCSATS